MTGRFPFVQAIAPSWLADFRCLGGACPHTCCQGWNIPVDEPHAQAYCALPDSPISEKLRSLMKTTQARKDGRKYAVSQLRLMDQPERSCPLLTNEGLCELQSAFGAQMLCDTCYFFPRNIWKLDDLFFTSADLTCPEAVRLALTGKKAIRLVSLDFELDPQADWFDSELIHDSHLKGIVSRRLFYIEKIIDILQNREFSLTERCKQATNFIERSLSPSSRAAGGKTLWDLSEIELIRYLDSQFNWGLESASAPFYETGRLMMRLTSGNVSPIERISENYRAANQGIYEPFLNQNPRLAEKALISVTVPELFRQIPLYYDPANDAEIMMRFESQLFQSIIALFNAFQIAELLRSNAINEAQFLASTRQFSQFILHYPEFLVKSLTRKKSSNPSLTF